MAAGNAQIADEVQLGRTLLVQGHLETAQRVLLKLCQAQPESAEAFRALALVLSKRGDERRAHALIEYANELAPEPTGEPSGAETPFTRLPPPPPPAPPQPPPAPVEPPPPVALPAPSAAVAPTPAPPARRSRWRGGVIVAFFAGVAVVASGVAIHSYRGAGKAKARPSSREQLDRALAAGTLEALMHGRDVARIELETRQTDLDALVRLGLVNAFLVLDYDVDGKADAARALQRAAQTAQPSPERTSLAATARALLALAAGDRAMAKQQADAAVAAVPEPPAYALLASARVRTVAGDPDGAARDLDRAMGLGAEIAPVQVDWAATRLDQGDPVAARRALVALLDRDATYSRARLLLADAERAMGEAGWSKDLDLACKTDAKISRNVRALCAAASAAQSRLDGDRGGALRKTRAAAQSTDDPQALAQMALLLALLGEVDAADELLARAAKAADAATLALRWADLAIRLGRGEKGDGLPKVEHPSGPERDLVVVRAALASSGVAGLASALKGLPPGIQDIDWEVRTLAKLAREGPLSKAEVAVLEKRAERWNPVASYVLGIFAVRAGDFKQAARRLERALAWHGDACVAAGMYADAVKRAGRPFQLNKAALKALHARNAKCPLPEL